MKVLICLLALASVAAIRCWSAEEAVSSSYCVAYAETTGFTIWEPRGARKVRFVDGSNPEALLSLVHLKIDILGPNASPNVLMNLYVVGEEVGRVEEKGAEVTQMRLLGWFMKMPFVEWLESEPIGTMRRYRVHAGKIRPDMLADVDFLKKEERAVVENLRVHVDEVLQICWIGKAPPIRNWIVPRKGER